MGQIVNPLNRSLYVLEKLRHVMPDEILYNA
jgi:hypothetical protein